jgi:hypothetical protein
VGVAGDDTPVQCKGKRVYGKARHRDSIRSTYSHTVWLFGPKWVVLAILVKLPCCWRYRALPVLAALYRDKATNQGEGRRHKTPTDLARQMLAVLIHWFPGRKFVFCGDGGFALHELARFCHRHRRHITLVSRFHPKANLYEEAPLRRSAAAEGEAQRPVTRQGPQVAGAAGGGDNRPDEKRRRRVVWRRAAERRPHQRRRPLVQSRRRAGAGALGARERLGRHASR